LLFLTDLVFELLLSPIFSPAFPQPAFLFVLSSPYYLPYIRLPEYLKYIFALKMATALFFEAFENLKHMMRLIFES
jgi:hypothetical protein